ncbi:RNA polymerase Rpc34 subunit-domain-containing protein [Pisolithus marmoratus]|nr:RNA polymerase Rpc34 subunit-domain-containing protein [Pisolithus marmoratus]
MSSRKLSADELKLHQAALNANDKILSVKEAGKLIPDAAARTAAINFLLGTGMFKVMASAGGVTAFRAVAKNEMEIKKDMTPEESMVLSHIQASGNEGIWTKHLKAKTELHQTVIDRCLKSLVQKQLVKSIKAVRHPTRKIYMLAHLEPSVELTGGPWYTDNELDAEFIKLLSSACLHYIRDRSFPKQNSKHLAQNQIRLYAVGAAPSYPSAQQIQHFLSKSKITETELGVEHVEMLLRVLELDGEIEKIPAFSASTWNPPSNSDETGPDSESDPTDDERSHSKKRKRGSSKIKQSSKLKRRKKKQDSDSESDSELEDRSKTKKRKKRWKRDEDSDEDSSAKLPKKRKRKSKRGDSSSEDELEEDKKKKHKRKSKKRQDSSSDEESESSEDKDGKSASKSNSLSKSKKSSTKKSSSVKRQKSPSPHLRDEFSGGSFVYRAIRQERVVLGWSQAPCGRCPVFDFCRDKGPTNPRECVYYEDWLASRTNSQKDTATASVKVEV